MTHPVYASERTALLLVDPYNDFLSDGGKLYSMLRSVADEVRLLDNLRTTVAAARHKQFRCTTYLIGAGSPATTPAGITPIPPNA